MKLSWIIFVSAIASSRFLFGELSMEFSFQKSKQLKQCLTGHWGVDPHTSEFLLKYFIPSLEKANGHLLIDDFVDKSIKLNIQFPVDKELICLSPHDGVILATKFHPVVFESPYVRIMAGCAAPKEREPFHTHAWRSLLIVFEDATYFVEYVNGTNEVLHLQAGVYELPPEDLYACTNVGPNKENCLRFEVKSSHETYMSTNEEKSLEAFEAEIAYFFGVSNQKPVLESYTSALKKLEIIGSNTSTELIEQEILPYLKDAYQSIAQQRSWNFDSNLAAQIELQIILGNANGSSFETIQELMIRLYTLVFQSDSSHIQKAAMLRTFLYQYKANILKNETKISQKDQKVMLEIAKTSEEYLNSIIPNVIQKMPIPGQL